MPKIRKSFAVHTAVFTLVCAFIITQASSVSAQTPEDVNQMRTQVADLLEKQKYIDALPLLEKILAADPQDATAHFYMGFALIAKANTIDDKAERQKLRVRARSAFVKAKELGRDDQLVLGLIQGIPPDGSEAGKYSANQQAEDAMRSGESFFSQGKLDEALAEYQKASKLDPKIYEAALYSGDVYLQKGEFDKAEIWYQKAIVIDPARETAYRYSATPLMRQKKFDQARDRYVEAFITEPYSRMALSGLIQWGQATGTTLAHPKFDIPEFEVGADGKAKSTISLGSLGDDSAMAWIGYTATRSEWHEKKFAQTFPAEKQYRHTLQEEAEALRRVVAIAKELKGKNKKLNPQIETLMKLDQDGLLEAYILLAIPDRGIAQDHAAYLKANRERLRQYVIKYVIGGGK